jgi:small GTP-binding protein
MIYNRKKVPTVAFVGLPNAGKSMLINRICGRNTAIVANEAHTTRDINEGYDWWENYYIRFVDTGGLVPDPSDKIQKAVQITSWRAIAEADVLVWVIDRRQDPDTISDTIVQRFWKTGKPCIVCINKVDNPNGEVEIFEYVRLGGVDFVNVSAMNGFGLNMLLDAIVKQLVAMGFESGNGPEETLDAEDFQEKKGHKHQVVRYAADGSIVVYRESGEKGKPGLFASAETEDVRAVKLSHICLDLDGVLVDKREYVPAAVLDAIGKERGHAAALWAEFERQEVLDPGVGHVHGMERAVAAMFPDVVIGSLEEALADLLEYSVELSDEWRDILGHLKEEKYHLALSTESIHPTRLTAFQEKNGEFFDEYFDAKRIGHDKSEQAYYEYIIKQWSTNAATTLCVEHDATHVENATTTGLWAIDFEWGATQIMSELDKIERGFAPRVAFPPKVLLLGKPNVGKSSLYNALSGAENQIVTEIAGTTLSVNDTHIVLPKTGKEYILLDSTGIRKAGKRTFGVETFATYRTIEAAHEADVILFMVDGSEPITAQDLLVAGIAKQTKAGLVVVVNKADIASTEDKDAFVRDFTYKMNFLKIDSFIWTSALKMGEGSPTYHTSEVWRAVDTAFANRSQYLSRDEVRKVFNYLMKQKPPKKLHNKKRAVVYDLVYTQSSPPTFELLVKDKLTIHWSYVRFLENTLRKQFGFDNTGVKIVLRQISKKSVV